MSLRLQINPSLIIRINLIITVIFDIHLVSSFDFPTFLVFLNNLLMCFDKTLDLSIKLFFLSQTQFFVNCFFNSFLVLLLGIENSFCFTLFWLVLV